MGNQTRNVFEYDGPPFGAVRSLLPQGVDHPVPGGDHGDNKGVRVQCMSDNKGVRVQCMSDNKGVRVQCMCDNKGGRGQCMSVIREVEDNV